MRTVFYTCFGALVRMTATKNKELFSLFFTVWPSEFRFSNTLKFGSTKSKHRQLSNDTDQPVCNKFFVRWCPQYFPSSNKRNLIDRSEQYFLARRKCLAFRPRINAVLCCHEVNMCLKIIRPKTHSGTLMPYQKLEQAKKTASANELSRLREARSVYSLEQRDSPTF